MKILVKKYLAALLCGVAAMGVVSCNQYLDKEPYSISPDVFFATADQLYAYSIARYPLLDYSDYSYNLGAAAYADTGTDNQMTQNSLGSRWLPGEWRVGSAGGEWRWGDLYTCNYFLNSALPKFRANEITGNQMEASHAIGEMFFFRAYFYFGRLKALGDCPIVYDVLKDEKESLMLASHRRPRNKVARMILSDLDSAFLYMNNSPNGGKNRLTKDVAKLFRSRVALYEGTFEKNFAGTAFVPGGSGWPGKDAEGYNNQTEVDYFLTQAMENAKYVADQYALASNPENYEYWHNDGEGGNASDYFEMFGTINQGLHDAKYQEVMVYRAFSMTQSIAHFAGSYLTNGANTGYTQQFMDAFVMRNGLPIYAVGSGYKSDSTVVAAKINRDSRYQLFVKGQGEILNDGAKDTEPMRVPLFDMTEQRANTGYMVKKGISREPSQTLIGAWGTTGIILFRAVEAYLNYIEACIEKTGSVDGTANQYWSAVRKRANINPDFNVTVAATDMNKEAEWDLGAWTAGQKISALRYNIRRERRCEFIAEGRRMEDLIRWRAMDQLQNAKFMPLGFNFWQTTYTRYTPYSWQPEQETLYEVREPKAGTSGSVSAKDDPFARGKYLVPLRLNIDGNNLYLNGVSWHPAHYLYPINYSHFSDATPTPAQGESADITKSAIYQNPGWKVESNSIPASVGGF